MKDKRKEPRISKPLNGIIDAKKAVFHFYLVMLKRGKKQDIKFTKSQFQRNCFIKLQRLEQKLSKVLFNFNKTGRNVSVSSKIHCEFMAYKVSKKG